MDLLNDVTKEFSRRLDENRGIAHGELITAVPVSPDEQDSVKKKLSKIFGKEIILAPRTDKRLLGGLIVRIGYKVIDGSTASKLESLRRKIAVSSG